MVRCCIVVLLYFQLNSVSLVDTLPAEQHIRYIDVAPANSSDQLKGKIGTELFATIYACIIEY